MELFADNRVVLVAAGIGTRSPRQYSDGRIASAGCYGSLVTLDPTGVLLVRPRAQLTVADVFRSWGQPLTAHQVASFTTPEYTHIRAFVNGRRWAATTPARIPLTRHAEIILEVGHDVVALRGPIGIWPAGTTGTVVSLYEDAALVEVAEDDPPGSALDNLLPVPFAQLELRWSHRTG